MRRSRSLILVLVLTPLLAGCPHANTTQLSPQGKAAYTADQIVIRVNELSLAAQQASGNGITENDARKIVTWCVSADKTLAAVPSGWQTTLSTGWTQLKAGLPTITNPAVVAALGAVDVVLASFGGN